MCFDWIAAGPTAIGLKTTDGVVLAIEKRINSLCWSGFVLFILNSFIVNFCHPFVTFLHQEVFY